MLKGIAEYYQEILYYGDSVTLPAFTNRDKVIDLIWCAIDGIGQVEPGRSITLDIKDVGDGRVELSLSRPILAKKGAKYDIS